VPIAAPEREVMLDGGARILHQPIVLQPFPVSVDGPAIGELESV